MVFWFGRIGGAAKSPKTIGPWAGSCHSLAGLKGCRRNRGDLLLEPVRQDHLAPEQNKRIGACPSLDPHATYRPGTTYYHQMHLRQQRRELCAALNAHHSAVDFGLCCPVSRFVNTLSVAPHSRHDHTKRPDPPLMGWVSAITSITLSHFRRRFSPLPLQSIN